MSKKIALLGGCFDPLHLGHIHLIKATKKQFALDKFKIIPAYQNPLKRSKPEASESLRLKWLRHTFKMDPFVEISDQEIKKKELNYTIDTVKKISKAYEIFLILGMDEVLLLDQWQNFKELLEKVHIVACPREGFEWKKNNFSKALLNLIKVFNLKKITLTTGKNIYLLNSKLVDISASYVREQVGLSKDVSHLVPLHVSKDIQKYSLYKKPENSLESLIKCSHQALLDKKAENIKFYDFRSCEASPALFTLVASGQNTRHTKILASYLQKQVGKSCSVSALHVEGKETGKWIVLDYTDLIIHIFYDYMREHYQIENLWKNFCLVRKSK